MSNFSKEQKIRMFASLFRGRTDVFAQRWEKWDGSASGYFLVYKDKIKKEYLPLNDDIIEEHLRGHKVIGIYPLLIDNTSWFIVADFDGDDWLETAKRLLEESQKYNLQAYIERSRSGKGGHVWWFFKKPCPAYKSRKIFLRLVKESKNMDEFDKEDSFDRLFPNQDYRTGKGVGNLIALPLQGNSRKEGNSIFLDPADNFKPFKDQWTLINSIKRINEETLNHLFEKFSDDHSCKKIIAYRGKAIPLVVSSRIIIPKGFINRQLSNFLAEELNFFNNEYAIKQKMGLSVYGVERYFKTIVKDADNVLIPRGFLNSLTAYLKENGIPYKIYDERNKCAIVKFKTILKLFGYQQDALKNFRNTDQGILVAPPGSGKTIMALSLISEKQQPALIITHRKQIYDQWIERVENFLQIPKRKIGQISGSKRSNKQPVTVAMVQTLSRMDNLADLSSQFGMVIVDECHHMPAKIFRKVITQFNPHYLYGLTATPIRKYNDEKLIFVYLGDIIHEVPKNFQQSTKTKKANEVKIKIQATGLRFPLKVKTEDYPLLSKVLVFDSDRNELIATDIIKATTGGKKCLVLTERKEHVEILKAYLKREFEVITLTGELTLKQKQERMKQIKDGNFQIIIATGQLIGEGAHFQNLDALFLVYPLAFEGKLMQYVGRLIHSDKNFKMVYDYRDSQIEYLEKMFKKRLKFYKKYFGIFRPE